MISGETRLVGLLGDPVSQSLSPLMQNAAFAARGLDWAYVPLPVTASSWTTPSGGSSRSALPAPTSRRRTSSPSRSSSTPTSSPSTRSSSATDASRVFDRRSNPCRARVRAGGDHRRRRRRRAFAAALPEASALLTQGNLAAGRCGRRPRRQRHVGARRGPRSTSSRADPRRPAVSTDGDRARRRGRGRAGRSTGSRSWSPRAPRRSSCGPGCRRR